METRDLESLLLDPGRTGDWIETLLTVPTEDRGIIDFVPTVQQRLMLLGQTGRDITVKGRQTRASSLFMSRNVRRMTTEYGLNCAMITQTDQMTQLFRARIKHHLNDLAERDLKYEVTKDNENELYLPRMRNRFFFGSAEQKTGPRGIQTAHIVHCSEVAFWDEERAKTIIGALIPACPAPPYGWFDLESTPNGAQGQFYQKAMAARPVDPMSKWTVHFYPWWLEKSYTIESYAALYDVPGLLDEFKPTDKEKALMSREGLSPSQVLWRRIQWADLLTTGKYGAQEYPEDMISCWLTAGEGYFHDDTFDHLGLYKDECHKAMLEITSLPYKNSEVKFVNGSLQVWEIPVPGATYVVFEDAAAGFSGGESRDADYTAITVLNAKTRHHAATLRLRATPERAGAMACAVGQYYNWAYLGIERNSYGAGSLAKAQELQYPNLYYDIVNNPKKPEAGWWTSETSRDLMLRTFREAVFEHSFTTHDIIAVLEMGTLVWAQATAKTKPRPEAREGAHDDVVMSLAGAYTIAPFAPTRSIGEQTTRRPGHQSWMR